MQPDNALYLNDAGLLHHTLANHRKAIEYLERALVSDLKTYGEDHPHVAIDRNNLGGAWDSLGEDHPNTWTVQVNLDAARTALSESQRD